MTVEQELTLHQEKLVKDAKWSTGTVVAHGVATAGTLVVANVAQEIGVSPESAEIVFRTGLAEFAVLTVAALNSARRVWPLVEELGNMGRVRNDLDVRDGL